MGEVTSFNPESSTWGERLFPVALPTQQFEMDGCSLKQRTHDFINHKWSLNDDSFLFADDMTLIGNLGPV